ncbi:SIR2 family protein [Mesorhizobium sp. M0847]|uniref:SIR2 family NAD-dependent protein deacylase n=1 Tax=unclassified Mesorhizobium TaxID=325217 RepID=UPI00333791B2
MSKKYLKLFPKPLLDDLVNGRWLPVVGAGMSLNARVPAGSKMPLWSDLARRLETDLDDFEAQGTLDAISAHEHAFGRPRLIERLSEILMLHDASPGEAHKEFCSIPFDIVCTTNFDFLLERQYEVSSRFVYPVVDEDQLSLNISTPGTLLLKLHGDLRHPNRLVVTESDYDAFLTKYPLIATYLANQLITKTAVLIGYSLDDPDFRQIWHVVAQRLGRNRRNAYAIAIDSKVADVARFARRGVTVISIPGSKSDYGTILAAVFAELREHYLSKVFSVSTVTEERPLRELRLPRDALSRLCFFAVPVDQLPIYRERVFPAVEAAGFVPVTADDVISPGDSIAAKIDGLIDRAAAVIVEPTSAWTLAELRLALSRRPHRDESSRRKPLVVISVVPSFQQLPPEVGTHVALERGQWDGDTEQFVTRLVESLVNQVPLGEMERMNEPQRLFNAKEYRAAVISAMSLLEAELRTRLEKPGWERVRRPMSMRQLAELAANASVIPHNALQQISDWSQVRNAAVHTGGDVSRATAQQVVRGVQSLLHPKAIF